MDVEVALTNIGQLAKDLADEPDMSSLLRRRIGTEIMNWLGTLRSLLQTTEAERDEAKEAALFIVAELLPLYADAAVVGRNYGWPEVLGAVMKVKREFLKAESRLTSLTQAHRRLEIAHSILKGDLIAADVERKNLAGDVSQLTQAQHRLIEQCICAAIRLPNGEVWRGHRHDNAIHTAMAAPDVTKAQIYEAEQGFVTSRNRFVGREEGAEIQRRAGIVSASTMQPVSDMLFSEDLYLRDWRSLDCADDLARLGQADA